MWNPKDFGFKEKFSQKLFKDGWSLTIDEIRSIFIVNDEEIWKIYYITDWSKGKEEEILANYSIKYEGKIPSSKFIKKLLTKGLNIIYENYNKS